MAALPGVVRTAVGYCGGSRPNPSYKAVCSDLAFDDYSETIHIDFDPNIVSYDTVLEAFFRCHDPIAAGRSRQYASIIFTHGDEQARAAQRAVEERPRVSTTIEDAAASHFWNAEAYHRARLGVEPGTSGLPSAAPALMSLAGPTLTQTSVGRDAWLQRSGCSSASAI